MNRESKWVLWYRILAIIGCVGIVIGSVVIGWNESAYYSRYSYTASHDIPVLLLYVGIGCAIAVVELIASMMICEFFDNVNMIKGVIQELTYSKDVREFLPTFKKMSENVDTINKEILRKKTE